MQLHEFAAVRPSGLIAIGLHSDDYLSWVKYTNGDQDIILVTAQGQSIRFHESDVRVMGRPASGVNAMKLRDEDYIAGMDVVAPGHTHLLVVTARGYGKRTALDQYGRQSRYGVGTRTLAHNRRTGPIVSARCIKEEDEILLITRSGVVLRTDLGQIRETGRSTQGVSLMNLGTDDEVAGIAIVNDEPNVVAGSFMAASNGNVQE